MKPPKRFVCLEMENTTEADRLGAGQILSVVLDAKAKRRTAYGGIQCDWMNQRKQRALKAR
jgi:hypothetical protein